MGTLTYFREMGTLTISGEPGDIFQCETVLRVAILRPCHEGVVS